MAADPIAAATAMRTDMCGTLGLDDAGRQVALCGWVARRREHGEHLAFVDLRDHSGIVQCVVDGAHDLRSEYVVRVTGVVRERPEGTANPQMATGEVEVGDCSVEILVAAEPPPFPVDERGGATEETIRIRHRYVDLRREQMQRNLRRRAIINSAIRRAMDEQGFVEIETPLLIASTPEGARDFYVPSRQKAGSVYSLPQSPQLFKQLCMVGGVDRYYQIARCARDEDLRADRQFEFTQLDAELSFASQDDVIQAISYAVGEAAVAAGFPPVGEMASMTWREAMDRYGSDKPDVRFGLELMDVTALFGATDFRAFQAPAVKCLVAPELTRGRIDTLTDLAKRQGAKGLAWLRVGEGGSLDGPIAKFLSDEEKRGLPGSPGDTLLFVADEWEVACTVLGFIRLELGRPPVTEGGLHFLWVVDFPMFEKDDRGEPTPAHHAFTMPHEDDLDAGLLESDPLAVRSRAYDLVLNGWELGSGSVRIHRPDIQQRVFDVLGIDAEHAQARFGFLLDAFKYGPPPHAGFAFGIDRLAAILCGEENIREVIAFPKTQSGADPLTGAPTPITAEELKPYGLRPL